MSMPQFFRRVWSWLRQQGLESDLADKRDLSREMKEQELQARSLAPSAAGFAPRHEPGNGTLAREDLRAAWILRWFEETWKDAAYASRNMRRQPGFTVVAIVTLMIGSVRMPRSSPLSTPCSSDR